MTVIVACGAGAIALGFPVITNETENIFRVPKSLIVQEDVSKFNATSLEARDIKIKITNIDIPVAFRLRLRGRDHPPGRYAGRVRRFPCGLLRAGTGPASATEVEDHKIERHWHRTLTSLKLGSKHSIAYVVEV